MKYTLKGLQMRYLEAELAAQPEGDQACLYCWKTSCGCNAPDIKTDAFLTTPNENEVLSYSDIKYA